MKIKLLGGLDGHERKGGGIQTGYQIFDPDGLCPTLLSDGGGIRNYDCGNKSNRENGSHH